MICSNALTNQNVGPLFMLVLILLMTKESNEKTQNQLLDDEREKQNSYLEWCEVLNVILTKQSSLYHGNEISTFEPQNILGSCYEI